MVIEYANNVLRLMYAYFPSGQAWRVLLELDLPDMLVVDPDRERGRAGPDGELAARGPAQCPGADGPGVGRGRLNEALTDMVHEHVAQVRDGHPGRDAFPGRPGGEPDQPADRAGPGACWPLRRDDFPRAATLQGSARLAIRARIAFLRPPLPLMLLTLQRLTADADLARPDPLAGLSRTRAMLMTARRSPTPQPARSLLSRHARSQHWDISGVDHDRGQKCTVFGQNCPRS